MLTITTTLYRAAQQPPCPDATGGLDSTAWAQAQPRRICRLGRVDVTRLMQGVRLNQHVQGGGVMEAMHEADWTAADCDSYDPLHSPHPNCWLAAHSIVRVVTNDIPGIQTHPTSCLLGPCSRVPAVMEALTVLGLTANICQFVDYAYKIVKEVNASPENITKEVEHASSLAQECLRTATKITTESTAMNDTRPLTDDEQGLVRLAERCRELATRMETLTGSIKGQSPNSKRGKFKSIFRNVKTKPEREKIQKQLDDCCRQLNLQISNISQ